jgi:hypothetical protein
MTGRGTPRARVDAADVAEQITTRMPRATEDEIVNALGGYTVPELRRIATQIQLPFPRDRKMTPDERRRYIAENIVRDRARWSLR